MEVIRNVHGIGPNRLSDNKIQELLRKNNRIIHQPTEDQVQFIRSYEKVMKDIRNVHEIGSNRLSDNNIEELLRKNNRIRYKPTEDQIKSIFNTYGIQIGNNTRGNKGGGYKPKKVKKTVTRIISGKERVIHTGLRGGKYYISNKKKVYI